MSAATFSDEDWSTARRAERWYVHPCPVGGWCVSTDLVPPLEGGGMVVADCMTKQLAEYIADQHNQTLSDLGPLRAYVPGLGDDPAPSGTNAEWVQGGVPRPGDPIAVYDHHAMLLGCGRVSEIDESHGIVRLDLDVSSVRRVDVFPFPVPPAEGDPDA